MGTSGKPETEMASDSQHKRTDAGNVTDTSQAQPGKAASSWAPKKWEIIIILLTVAP